MPVELKEPPICDICRKSDAVCDAKTVLGPWAYMCEDCKELFAVRDFPITEIIITVKQEF